MKKNILTRIVPFLIAIVLITGCKAKKIVAASTEPSVAADSLVSKPIATDDHSKTEKLSAINAKSVKFNTLVLRSKAALSIAGKSNDVTMNIRIRNNEAIWVSVTAVAGLEVARALITTDSVKVLNRLDNEYISKPFSYIYEFTNNNINFATLQSVLVGNPIAGFLNDSAEIVTQSNQTNIKNTIATMLYEVLANGNDKVIQTNLVDEGAAQKLNVEYGEFQTYGQQVIPGSVVMKSQVKEKNITLDLKISKAEFDVPADMPFRVPERFVIKN